MFYGYTGIRNIQALGENLAFQILHDLHKTEFPLKTRLKNSQYIISFERMRLYTYTKINIQIANAKDRCEAKGSKLISEKQMKIIMNRGIYNNGYQRGDLEHHSWVFDTGIYWNFDPYANYTIVPINNRPHALETYFFCTQKI